MRLPGQAPEQLLELMTFRRSDGNEASLGELPIEQVLRSGETMRAEEVVLSVPDRRSVRVLVNAAPVRAEGDLVGGGDVGRVFFCYRQLQGSTLQRCLSVGAAYGRGDGGE